MVNLCFNYSTGGVLDIISLDSQGISSIGTTGWAQPNMDVPSATEAQADKLAQGAIYHFRIMR